MSDDEQERRRDEINLYVALLAFLMLCMVVRFTTPHVKQFAAELRTPPAVIEKL